MIISLALCLSSCGGKIAILDNSDKSKFVDFYTEGDYVYIQCELNVYAEKDCTVSISAIDNEDVKSGLLKSSRLVGIDTQSGEEEFVLKQGENTVNILFRGDYAGVYQIENLDIPRFIDIEVK